MIPHVPPNFLHRSHKSEKNKKSPMTKYAQKPGEKVKIKIFYGQEHPRGNLLPVCGVNYQLSVMLLNVSPMANS